MNHAGDAVTRIQKLHDISVNVNNFQRSHAIFLNDPVENFALQLRRWIDDFILLGLASGHCYETIRKRKRCLKSLHDLAREQSLTEFAAAAESWAGAMYATRKRFTAASMIGEASTFALWLFHKGHIDRMPRLCYKRPPTLPKAIRLDQIKDFIPFLYGEDTKLLMRFLLDTALRIGAALSLTRENFDLDTMTVFAISKGKLHKVTVGRKLRRELRHHVMALAPGARLFPRPYNTYNSRVWRAAKRAARHDVAKAGPHKMRHSFARHFCLEGGQPPALQTILGHSTPNMSMHYARVYSDDALKQQRAFSPVDRMEG